jgi:hypothetical protein
MPCTRCGHRREPHQDRHGRCLVVRRISAATGRGAMMQFNGGYRYPDLTVALALVALLLAWAVVLGARYTGSPMSPLRTASLACSLLGTALLGSAFTPVGLVPPQGGLRARVLWFFKRQGGVTVEFTQWAFYVGLLLLAVAVVLTAVA